VSFSHPAARLLLAFAACAIAALAAPAHAAAVSPPGTNLRWDKCYGDNGAWNKDFACDTNTGTERLVGSFELAAPVSDISGMELYVDLASVSAAYPVWWQIRNTGTCRAAALGFTNSLPAGSANCVDWGEGHAVGGIGRYDIGAVGPNHARLIMAVAVPAANVTSLIPGREYFAFTATITHVKTVGTGACAGCLEPVCIFFSTVRLESPGATSTVMTLTRGANYLGSQYVTWQRGYPINIATGSCSGQEVGGTSCIEPHTSFDCVPYSATQTRGSTWGEVKSLYR
jgi:hypothetical protein